jgi:hypothetical protein
MIEKKTEIFTSGLYVFRYEVKILKLIIAETGYAGQMRSSSDLSK